MNIIFAIKALGNKGGGAERVLIDVTSGLVRRGHTITIISNDPEGQASYYPMNDAIQRISLDIGNVAGKSSLDDVLRRIIRFRRTVARIRPDVVVAFMHSTYLPMGGALIGTGIPMIASEHISPEHYQNRWLERILLQLTPLIAAKITVVTNQILLSFGWWLRRRMTVIPNPVSSGTIGKKSMDLDTDLGCRRILLSVGRLAPQKNQQCLIAAFSQVSIKFPNWKLRIVGEGELREALEAQVLDLGLSESVELPGAVSDVSQEYRKADLFVLPSTYESFGLATAEALMHGLPVVGFADCPGTNTLIRNNENGMLVEGVNQIDALATALIDLMADPKELHRLASASSEWLESQFNINSVLDRWEELIEEVVGQQKKGL
ncbi:MAG: glycosyltransferase family 4 protein [Nitrosomonas sp.]|nr:glycosyltransferase family 4 protein [Nitrosomonas sp.]